MSPLPPVHALFAVLLIPPQGCPTKDVYQAFDSGHQHRPPHSSTDWPACARATAEELSQLLVNDLEPAAYAVAPWLKTLRDHAQNSLNRPIHLTGSGSTLFTLCSSGAQAEQFREKLAALLGPACGAVAIRVGPAVAARADPDDRR